MVRDSRQHLREFTDRFRFPAWQTLPGLSDPARSRDVDRHDADLGRTADHALHPALHTGRLCRAVLHRIRHRRVPRRRGAAYRRRHLHQDCRHRFRLDEDRLQDQRRRCPQPWRDRRLHRRQCRRLGGTVGRWFRNLRRDRRRSDYLHLAGVKEPTIQVQLLVWIFVMRIMMLVSSALAYFINGAIAKARYSHADTMNFETPLTSLVWLTSIVSIIATYFVSYLIIPNLGGDPSQWWKLASIISCGTLAGALIPELVKVFTSVESRHVNEVVTSAKEGGASLGILSGLVAGNFSAYWLGLAMVALMSIAYMFSGMGLAAAATMIAAPVFA